MQHQNSTSVQMASLQVEDIQKTLDAGIPICTAMQLKVVEVAGRQLAMQMPLQVNRNHKYTAFAGSLNSLCTAVGWGTMYLLLHEFNLEGEVVIRRGNIRFHHPVDTEFVLAKSLPIDEERLQYFCDMVRAKGRGKLDLQVEIQTDQNTAVRFEGSYVVMPSDS